MATTDNLPNQGSNREGQNSQQQDMSEVDQYSLGVIGGLIEKLLAQKGELTTPQGKSFTYNVAVGDNGQWRSLGFLARTVVVDNFTSQWLYVHATASYCPPNQAGWNMSVVEGTQIGRCVWEAPPGVVQPASTAGNFATLRWYEGTAPGTTGAAISNPATAALSDVSDRLTRQLGQILSGSVQLFFVNALAITDTIAHVSGSLSFLTTRNKTLQVTSTLNQSANLQVQACNDLVNFANVGGVQAIAAGTTVLIGPDVLLALGQSYAFYRTIITCPVAPTSGVISVLCEGLQ